MRLLAIDERSSGLDPVLGQIFCSMRATIGWPVADIARHLGASAAMVQDLEAGRIRTLPAWNETARIIIAYGHLVRVDVRPILERLRQQQPTQVPLVRLSGTDDLKGPAPQEMEGWGAPGRHLAIFASLAAGTRWLFARRDDVDARGIGDATIGSDTTSRRRWLRRVALCTVMLMAPLIGGLLMALLVPSPKSSAPERFPSSLVQTFRSGVDSLALRFGTIGGGLKWIEVDDPATRKADRLPVAAKKK